MSDWLEHVRNGEIVARVFKKCSQIDEILGKPVARTEIQKYIKPLQSLADQAREALSLEDTVDGLLAALKIL
jgi:hypothetical protein